MLVENMTTVQRDQFMKDNNLRPEPSTSDYTSRFKSNHNFSILLERVIALEEKNIELQKQINELNDNTKNKEERYNAEGISLF